jgi:hypothetical protein
MMGRQTGDQSQLLYLFNLERPIPACHPLRQINPVVTRLIAAQWRSSYAGLICSSVSILRLLRSHNIRPLVAPLEYP